MIGEIIIALLRGAAEIASAWVSSNAEERAELEARAGAAVAAMRGERDATAAAHDARAAASDAAIDAAEKRAGGGGGGSGGVLLVNSKPIKLS